jgi:hypothetical protein
MDCLLPAITVPGPHPTTTAGIVAATLAPVAAVGTWLLVTDPEVAGEVAADRSVLPLVEAIAETLGRALVQLVAYL